MIYSFKPAYEDEDLFMKRIYKDNLILKPASKGITIRFLVNLFCRKKEIADICIARTGERNRRKVKKIQDYRETTT